jgi:uncharacterized protein YuzE
MKISFDSSIDTKYVSIKKGKIVRTQRICDWLFFDLNNKNEVLGVEVIDASKNYFTLFTNGQDLIGYTARDIHNNLLSTPPFEVAMPYSPIEVPLAYV